MSNEETKQIVSVGDHVIFHKPDGTPCDALITAVWSQECVNVIYVSDDTARQDSYGRQFERATSVPRVSSSAVHGYNFRTADEEANAFTPPEQS